MAGITEPNAESNLMTRRSLLARLGGVGVVAALGAGLLDALGARSASASGTNSTSSSSAGGPVLAPVGAATPAPPAGCPSGEVECTLDEGACGGPCPSGYWCYSCQGYPTPYCIVSGGEKTICI